MSNEQSEEHYQTLQLSPTATQEEIRTTFQRLVAQYDPERLVELAPDLRRLAQERRRQIEAAYELLGDEERRKAYDAARLQAAQREELASDVVDYRPLAALRRAEGGVKPIAVAQRSDRDRPRLAAGALIIAGLTALIVAVSLLLTAKERGYEDLTADEMRAIAAAPTPTLPPAITSAVTDTAVLEFLAGQQQQIDTLSGAARQSGSAEDWIAYGNAVFDYLETLREQTGGGQAYQALAVRWVEALEAYQAALEQQPTNGLVRSDYAVALVRLAQARGDDASIQDAQREAAQALQDDPQGPRTMLNAAIVFASAPDGVDEARGLLELLVEQAPQSREAELAQQMLQGELQ